MLDIAENDRAQQRRNPGRNQQPADDKRIVSGLKSIATAKAETGGGLDRDRSRDQQNETKACIRRGMHRATTQPSIWLGNRRRHVCRHVCRHVSPSTRAGTTCTGVLPTRRNEDNRIRLRCGPYAPTVVGGAGTRTTAMNPSALMNDDERAGRELVATDPTCCGFRQRPLLYCPNEARQREK